MAATILESLMIDMASREEPNATLAYADWLEEEGEAMKAAFLRDSDTRMQSFIKLVHWLEELGMWSNELLVQNGRLLHSANLTMVGLSSLGVIEPGSEATVVMRPFSGPFRPTRIVISPDSAQYFEVLDVFVGNKSQLTKSGPIPAIAFSTQRCVSCARSYTPEYLSFDTVQCSQDFGLRVRNTSCLSATLQAVAFGVGYY